MNQDSEIYSYLNSKNFDSLSFSNNKNARSFSYASDDSLLSCKSTQNLFSSINLYLRKTFTSPEKINKSAFVYYHIQQEDLEIHAVGIANPKKLQSYMSVYRKLIAASMARLSKLIEPDDLMICFFDKNTISIVKNFLGHDFFNRNRVLFIKIDSSYSAYPMWYRFKLIQELNKMLFEIKPAFAFLYMMDSDYIPSGSFRQFRCESRGYDVVFTTNADSFPVWQINEGLYSCKVNSNSLVYMEKANQVYNYLINDDTVKRYWKNPMVWRGAQASLMLAAYKFGEFSDEDLTLKMITNGHTLRIKRFPGTLYNSPLDADFNSKQWCFNDAKCYHLTGYYKQNPLLDEFLSFCLKERSSHSFA